MASRVSAVIPAAAARRAGFGGATVMLPYPADPGSTGSPSGLTIGNGDSRDG
jgi:hypothetical protein